MAFDNVTVFFMEDGTVCDPFDQDVYLCASFSPGGLIIDYRFVRHYSNVDEGILNAMDEQGLECITVSEPLNSTRDVLVALNYAINDERW